MPNKQPSNAKEEEKLRAQIIARAWKDPTFKAKLLKNPKAALADMGYKLPDNAQIHVFEDKPNNFNFVLPLPPYNTRELSDKEIQQLAAGVDAQGLGTLNGALHRDPRQSEDAR